MWIFSSLLFVLGSFTSFFVYLFTKDFKKNTVNKDTVQTKFWIAFPMGFFASFFNALGVGSFATITSLNNFWRQVSDKLLPGTMLIGVSGLSEPLTTVVPLITNIWPETQSFFHITEVGFKIEAWTLLWFFITTIIGGYWGSKVVSKWNEKKVQLYMGIGLLSVAVVMVMKNIPLGNGSSIWTNIFGSSESTYVYGFSGFKLIFASIVIGFIGFIHNMGVGYYAPVLAFLPLMGMSMKTALFVAYVGCAIGTNVSTIGFIHSGQYNRVAAIAFLIAGGISTIVATIIVGSMDTKILNYIVNGVLFYVSTIMIMRGTK